MRWLPLLVLLLLPALWGCDGKHGRIPDKTVVLTFDDAIRNHLDFVAPLLEEHGFGATFYVSAVYLEREPESSLTWEELAELHRRGFEIGDHTRSHALFSHPGVASHLPGEIGWMRDRLSRVDIPEPATFAWPGSAWGPEALDHLRAAGYRFARRGRIPDQGPGSPRLEEKHAYDPSRHDPLLIPSFDVGKDWTLDVFRRALALAEDGHAVVFQFHGVPDPHNEFVSALPETFRAFIDLLAKGDYKVIALRDLGRWVDPTVRPDDPNASRRIPQPQ